jgi:hypothetical protein
MTNQLPVDLKTISWIFLAVSMASQIEPTDFRGISMVADGINHAVPTHKEMQTSITWLVDKGLVTKVAKKYTLTEKGKDVYKKAHSESIPLLKMWHHLESEIENY